MVLAGSSLETWDLNNVVRKLFWNFDDGSACWMKVLIRLARARAAVLTKPSPPSAVFLNKMFSGGRMRKPCMTQLFTAEEILWISCWRRLRAQVL